MSKRIYGNEYGFQTRAVHTGNDIDGETGAIKRPITMANSYELPYDPSDLNWSSADKSLYTRNGGSNQKYLQEKVSSSKNTNNYSYTGRNNLKSQSVSPEINLLGLTVDEAVPLVDKYLDDCFMAKLSPVRIVHGKGTGALRNGIHKYLKTNKYVDSYRMGTFGEGEMGVTIVTLKIK